MLKFVSRTVLAAAAIMSVSVAKADMMKIEAFGVVVYHAGFAPLGAAPGDQVRATFVYDSAVVATYPNSAPPGTNVYSNVFSPPAAINPVLISSNLTNLTAGGSQFSMHNYFSQRNNAVIYMGSDSIYRIVDRSINENGDFYYFNFMTNETGLVQSLTQAGNISATGSIQIVDTRDNTQIIAELTRFVVTDLDLAPPIDVPEPASLILLGAGLLGLAATRKRRAGVPSLDR